MLYYSHFVVASSLTTFRFLTDLQLLYLDAVDNFLNCGSLDRRPLDHGAVDHDPVDHALLDPAPLNPEPLDLEPRGLEPLDLEPLDLKSVDLEPAGPEPVDHGPASLPAPIDQDNFAAAVMVAAVMPVMSEPRLALINGGKIDGGKLIRLLIRTTRANWNRSRTAEQMRGQAIDLMSKTAGNKTARRQPGEKMAGSTRPQRPLSPSRQEPHFSKRRFCPVSLSALPLSLRRNTSRGSLGRSPRCSRSTVRATYQLAKKPGEAFAEAQHQINDIIAEVRAEDASHAGMRAAEELRAAA